MTKTVTRARVGSTSHLRRGIPGRGSRREISGRLGATAFCKEPQTLRPFFAVSPLGRRPTPAMSRKTPRRCPASPTDFQCLAG